MSSEWIKLFDVDVKREVYVNLANASAIYPHNDGSAIWFLEHPENSELGRILVQENPQTILRKLHRAE